MCIPSLNTCNDLVVHQNILHFIFTYLGYIKNFENTWKTMWLWNHTKLSSSMLELIYQVSIHLQLKCLELELR